LFFIFYRNLPQVIPDEPPTNLIMHSGLELKICVNTYKLFFVNNTEDYFRRCNVKIPEKQLKLINNKRKAKFVKWFSKVNNISEEEGKKSLAFDEKKEVNTETAPTKTNNINNENKEKKVVQNDKIESKDTNTTTTTVTAIKPSEPVKEN